MKSNVKVVTRDRGKLVASCEGHNIMTDVGRELLAQLVSWYTISDVVDVPNHDRRLRYIGVGLDYLPETVSVRRLKAPQPYDVSGPSSFYLAELDVNRNRFINCTTLSVGLEFGPSQVSMGGTPVVIKEMGLYMDVSPAGVLDPLVGTNELSFYKAFPEGILKLPTFSLEIAWELRF